MKQNKLISIIVAFAILFIGIASMSCSPKEEKVPSWTETIAVAKYGITEVFSEESAGSGVIVYSKDKTRILTNYHIVQDAIKYKDDIFVRFFGSDESYKAIVLVYLEDCDLALLSLDYVFDKAHVFEFSQQYFLAENVLALGYNGGQLAVYDGIINMPEKLLSLYDKNHYVIQSSTGFALGSSGGALINKNGELLGITTFSNSFNGQFIYSGGGYSINSKIAQAFIERAVALTETNLIYKMAAGFSITAKGGLRIMLASNLNFEIICTNSGIYVSDVSEGCMFAEGDKITSVNGKEVKTITDVIAQTLKTYSDTVFI